MSRPGRVTAGWSKRDPRLPGGIGKIYLRGDSALYEHELMRWLDEQAIGYAISADYEPALAECTPLPRSLASRHDRN